MVCGQSVQVLARVAIKLPHETLNHRGNMSNQLKQQIEEQGCYNPELFPNFTLLELNIILKALKKSALEAKPFSEEGIKTVRLAERIIKNMQSIVDTFPEDIQKVIWKESEVA